MGDDIEESVLGFTRRHRDFFMTGSEMPGHTACIVRFIIHRPFREGDGESTQRLVQGFLSQSTNQRGIQAAGKEGPQRHIRNQVGPDRIPKYLGQALHSLFNGIRLGFTLNVKIGADFQHTSGPDPHPMSWRKASRGLPDGVRRGDIIVGRVEAHGLKVDIAGEIGPSEQRPQFRSEKKA